MRAGEPSIVVFGAGAIGGTIAGWLAPYVKNLTIVDLPKTAELLREKGITTYLGSDPSTKKTVNVKTASSLKDVPKPDYVLLCVKNYSLESVCKLLGEQISPDTAVVGFQNGVENETILPKYFKNVIYGIIAYNAWIQEPGVIGYQKHGPLVLGAKTPELTVRAMALAQILNRGVPTVVTDRLADAAHSKMIINLANSLTTLVGHGFREISDPAIFQKLLTGLTAEGVEIVQAAGFHEFKMAGMPSWTLMKLAAKLPAFLIRPIFRKNLKKMVVSSMAQDILQRGSTDSELESLNGYFIRLADQYSLKVPYNRAIYSLCRRHFGIPGFKPLDVREVWQAVQNS